MTLVLVEIPLLALVLSQERTWGGPDIDQAAGVAVDGDNVIVVGMTRSFGVGGEDAFLLKYDSIGNLLWQRTYGTGGDERGMDVAAAADGSAYITGQFGDGSVFVAKFSTGGSLVWQKTWGAGNSPRAVEVDGGGNVYVTGITSNAFGVGESDAFLLKFSADGTLLWQKTWGGPFFDRAQDVAIEGDGVYIAGDTNSFGGRDAFLVRFDVDGNVVWQRNWRIFRSDGVTAGEANAVGVGTASDGSVYITGNTFEAGFLENIILVKFDAAGNVLWEKVGGPGFGAGQDVAVAQDGIVYVTGNLLIETLPIAGGNAFVMAFQPNGKARSADRWGGADDEFASGESIAISLNGSIVVAGFAGAPPYEFAKAAKGAKTPNALLLTPAGTTTTPGAAAGDANGVMGTPTGSETFAGATDAVMLRLQP